MTKKILFISLVLLGFAFFVMAEVYLADTSAQLEQAKLNIISLIKEGNYAEAEVQTQKLIADFSEHKDIAEAAWQIAKGYEQSEKYDKAIQLHQYNVEHFPNDIHAMWSQSRVIRLHISSGDDVAADAAFNKLLTVFSKQPTLPKEVWQVAKGYEESKKYDKALELNQYNVEHFPKSEYAMWSQSRVVRSHIRDGNDAAADEAFKKLLAVFSDQPTLPKEINEIANRYNEAGRSEKAMELRKCNIEHFPESEYAMWSQSEITYSHIRNGNDAAAEAAVNNLLTVFSQQPTLPKEIYQIAKMYGEWRRNDRAFELYQYNIEHFPKDIHAMWSQMEITYSHIRDGNDAAADEAYNKLMTVFSFSDQPTLPREVCQIADAFRKAERYDKANQLYQYVVDNWPLDSNSILVQSYVIRANIALGNIQVAEAAAEKMIADHPNDDYIAEAVYEIAYSYYQVGQYEKAVKYFQKIVNDWPDYKYAWNAQCWIGECYWKLKESGALPQSEVNPQIKLAYQTLIEKYPDCSLAGHACLKLAHLSSEEGRQVDAAMYLEMFLQNSPDDPRVPDVLYDLGQIYEQMGQSDSAMEVYAKFIKVDPNSPLVKNLLKKFEELGGQNR